MSILIKNANLISMANSRPKFEENVDILINNNIIEKIDKNILESENTKIINATNKIVMPGFINTHAHVPMSIFRETLDGLNLQEWLKEKIWPMEDKLTGEDIYFASLLSFIEMIKNGCTCVNDMYFLTEQIIKVAIECGIRLCTTRTLLSVDPDIKLKEFDEIVNKYKNIDGKIMLNMGIHGLYTTNKEDLVKFLKYAKDNKLMVHMHFCENKQEVEDIKNKYNVESPMDVIEEYFRDIPTILAHCVILTNDEINRLKKYKNISVSHCPVSNLKLGCGIAKIQKMLDNNILVSIGTDGQGSGSNLDMLEAAKYATLLQKGINENPKNIPAYEALKLITINGAKALKIEDKVGSIEEGKCADLIVLNTNTETMTPTNDIFANILYNAKGYNVDTTIVNGEILMENRVLTKIIEKDVFKQCSKIISRINT